uniref:Cytochrome c oxidase subunit 7C, mitochondrial n=1 Tax=Culicoides sonorensis TaxID=179676 RepID=A0A336MD10_CULSO
MLSRTLLSTRNVMQTAIRKAHHRDGGVPCENMPFRIDSKPKFTLIYTIFVASGVAVPFFAVRHQLTK